MSAAGTDKRRHSFFIIDNEIIDSYDLSGMALATYTVLVRYLNKDLGYAFPSRPTLAKTLKVTPKTVDKYVKELEDAGLVSVDRVNGELSHYYIESIEKKQTSVKFTPPSVKNDTTQVQNLHPIKTKEKDKVKRDSAPGGETAAKEPEIAKESEDVGLVQEKTEKPQKAIASGESPRGQTIKGSAPDAAEKRRNDLLFEIICIGSFGKRYEHINGQAGRAAKIRQGLLEQLPELTPDELEAAYRFYAKQNPEFVKTPAKRLKSVVTILDWIEQAKDNAPKPIRTPEEIKADEKWTWLHDAYIAMTNDLPERVLAMSPSSLRSQVKANSEHVALTPWREQIESEVLS